MLQCPCTDPLLNSFNCCTDICSCVVSCVALNNTVLPTISNVLYKPKHSSLFFSNMIYLPANNVTVLSKGKDNSSSISNNPILYYYIRI